MAILRSQRTYPLALKSTAQYALNEGITAAYDYQGDPNNNYAGGNGARHVGTKDYTAPTNNPILVDCGNGIFGRDPSINKTVLTYYSGLDLLNYGIGSADGKGNFTFHRRYRMPTAVSSTSGASTRVLASFRDAAGAKITIQLLDSVNGYFYFRFDVNGTLVPSASSASSNTAIRRNPGTIVDIHFVRNGDVVSWYLDGVLAATATLPALVTYNTAYSGSPPANSLYTAPAQDMIHIDETYWNRALTSTEIAQHQADPYAGYVNTASVPDGISISNPSAGATVNSEGFTIGGSYAGSTTPTGIQYRFNSSNAGDWADLQSLSLGGSVYSGTTGPVPSGTGTLEVRFANATSIATSVNSITAKPPLPTVTLDSQPSPDGQSQTFNLTTTRATSVDITLVANGNGATTQGPTRFAVVNNAVTAVFSAIPAGDYTVQIVANGDGGTATIPGNPFTILGVSGGGEPTPEVTPGNTAPGAPVIGTAVAGNGYIDVYFNIPASDGGSAIIDYTATLSTGESEVGVTSPIRVAASNGMARTATVTARNGVGTGPASEPSNSVTPFVPYVPSISVTLKDRNQQSVLAGTVLYYAWFDQSNPQAFEAPAQKGTISAPGGNAPVVITLANSTLITDGVGWLDITDSTGDPTTIHRSFSGPVKVL